MTKAFISYSRHDAEAAEQVVAALARASVDAWVDVTAIELGENFLLKMEEGLKAADYVVLLHSAHSATSRFVQVEWTAAMARGIVIIPIMLDDTEVPALLQAVNALDLRRDRDAGLERLVAFFMEDNEDVAPRTLAANPAQAIRVTKHNILQIAQTCVDNTAFFSILFHFEYGEGEIPGESHMERVTRLALRMRRDGELSKLADWLLEDRTTRRCVLNQLRRDDKEF